MPPETAIIIRTKNEERWLKRVLETLFKQTYKDFEIIVIDSGSTDRTLAIAREFPVTVLEIPAKSFSYPYALNYAIEYCHATTFVVTLSAHALPISSTWLADGIQELRSDLNIAGVYGFVRALPDATMWDKIFQNVPLFIRKNEREEIKAPRMGILGFTNAIIRKDLWEKHHFDEAYGGGGEDGEWAAYWLARGYHIVRDPKFTVMHSHYLSLWGWLKQLQYWKSLGAPHPFQPLRFRKSNTHT